MELLTALLLPLWKQLWAAQLLLPPELWDCADLVVLEQAWRSTLIKRKRPEAILWIVLMVAGDEELKTSFGSLVLLLVLFRDLALPFYEDAKSASLFVSRLLRNWDDWWIAFPLLRSASSFSRLVVVLMRYLDDMLFEEEWQ